MRARSTSATARACTIDGCSNHHRNKSGLCHVHRSSVYKTGHVGAATILGDPAGKKVNARAADGATPFLTGSGLRGAAQPKKDAKATAKFRGTWVPQLRNPSNKYGFQGIAVAKKAAAKAKPKRRAPPPKPKPEAWTLHVKIGWTDEVLTFSGVPPAETLAQIKTDRVGPRGGVAPADFLAFKLRGATLPDDAASLADAGVGDGDTLVLARKPAPPPPKPKPAAKPAPEKTRVRVTLLVSTYGDAYHATQRRLRNILEAHLGAGGFTEVDGAFTHLPEMIKRRNELFKISGLRGKYPQLFIDDQFVGSYEECNDANESDEFKQMLFWRLSQEPTAQAGTVIQAFYAAKYGGGGGGVKIDMTQFDRAIGN